MAQCAMQHLLQDGVHVNEGVGGFSLLSPDSGGFAVSDRSARCCAEGSPEGGADEERPMATEVQLAAAISMPMIPRCAISTTREGVLLSTARLGRGGCVVAPRRAVLFSVVRGAAARGFPADGVAVASPAIRSSPVDGVTTPHVARPVPWPLRSPFAPRALQASLHSLLPTST